jgi:hypothetical protein
MFRSTIRRLGLGCALAALGAVSIAAQAPAQPQVAAPDTKPSALAPANLTKSRPKPPFDLTGNWFIDNSPGIQGWLFGPATIPKLKPEAQKHRDAYVKAIADGKVYRDDIGQCWPAGVPIIMTRVWPIAMIQVPTAIYMVSGFMNSLRTVFLDGRTHTDPDIVVRTFNGESIGRWEGDTLVVETTNFNGKHSYRGSTTGLHLTERYTRIDEGRLELRLTVSDPTTWEKPWTVLLPMRPTEGQLLLEYACHEANLSMFNILEVARDAEKAAAKGGQPAPSRPAPDDDRQER